MSFFNRMGQMPTGQPPQQQPMGQFPPQQLQQQPAGQLPPQQPFMQQHDQRQMHPSYFSGFQMPQQWQQRLPQAGGYFSHFGGQQ